MDYAQANAEAVRAGTERREKMKKVIQQWSWVGAGAATALWFVVWAIIAIESNIAGPLPGPGASTPIPPAPHSGGLGIIAVVVGALLAAAVLALVLGKNKYVEDAWKQISAHPRLSLFIAWTLFIYAAAVALHAELRPWLLSWQGAALLIILIAMVIILYTGKQVLKESWGTYLVFVVLTILVVDPGIMREMPQAFKDKFRLSHGSVATAPAKTTTATAPSTASAEACDTAQKDYFFDTVRHGATIVDPGSRCGALLWYAGHCIEVLRGNGETPTFCDLDGKKAAREEERDTLPPDIIWAKSLDTPFTGHIQRFRY